MYCGYYYELYMYYGLEALYTEINEFEFEMAAQAYTFICFQFHAFRNSYLMLKSPVVRISSVRGLHAS
jgi:hypothetical protein